MLNVNTTKITIVDETRECIYRVIKLVTCQLTQKAFVWSLTLVLHVKLHGQLIPLFNFSYILILIKRYSRCVINAKLSLFRCFTCVCMALLVGKIFVLI